MGTIAVVAEAASASCRGVYPASGEAKCQNVRWGRQRKIESPKLMPSLHDWRTYAYVQQHLFLGRLRVIGDWRA